MSSVILHCVKENSKLRVKIISNGYNNTANCQFPKDIRKENLKYKVPAEAIRVIRRGNNKFFYQVSKALIEIVEDEKDIRKLDKIYDIPDCCVCLGGQSEMVMVPCGHLCLCSSCSEAYKDNKCPICRSIVELRIHKTKLK